MICPTSCRTTLCLIPVTIPWTPPQNYLLLLNMGRSNPRRLCNFHYDGATTRIRHQFAPQLYHLTKLEEAFWNTLGQPRSDRLPDLQTTITRIGNKTEQLVAIAAQLTEYWHDHYNTWTRNLPLHLLHQLQYNIRRVEVATRVLHSRHLQHDPRTTTSTERPTCPPGI